MPGALIGFALLVVAVALGVIVKLEHDRMARQRAIPSYRAASSPSPTPAPVPVAAVGNPPAGPWPVVLPAPAIQPDLVSPQTVFEAQKEAILQGQYRRQFTHLTPESQDWMLQKQIEVAHSYAAQAPDRGKGLHAILTKYGASATIQGAASGVTDKASLFGEVRAWVEPLRQPSSISGALRTAGAAARLMNVRIDGDEAEGESVTQFEGRESRKAMRFRRINGEWRIHL